MKQASVGLNYLVGKHTCPIITVHHLCVGLSHRAKHTVYKNEPKISYTQPGLTIECANHRLDQYFLSLKLKYSYMILR
jgi:hypothetical protein